jgi:hypothetical protein
MSSNVRNGYNPYSNEVQAPKRQQVANLLDLDDADPSPVHSSATVPSPAPASNQLQVQSPHGNTQADLLALSTSMLNIAESNYVPPKQIFMQASAAKGMEISGTFARRNGEMSMDITITNRAMQPISDFAIQFNKNT